MAARAAASLKRSNRSGSTLMDVMTAGDSPELRKQRGAFFTPYAIAQHLADWALRGTDNGGLILDPSCGDGVFLRAAEERLASVGKTGHLFGVDVHAGSLELTDEALGAGSQPHTLLLGDFFEEATPDQLNARLPFLDAIVGNPPFIRYHEHRGDARKRAHAAALAQGVRLSGLASSWAPLLVHASAFLKPTGRIAMVLPAELLSVGYAEPIRQWLKRRFRSVHLVLFENLQFEDAEAQVVLLVARGSGGCNAFTLHHVQDASDLEHLHIYDADAFAPQADGKWTDLLIPEDARGLLRQVIDESCVPLSELATCELGTVTGANGFFCLSQATKEQYRLQEGKHVVKCVPPGTKHLKGLQFTAAHWEQARLDGLRVWMLNPSPSPQGDGVLSYLAEGERLGVSSAYKCSVRTPWWRPPITDVPDLFFTYMSHVSPRFVSNGAAVTFVNSMHGVTLKPSSPAWLREALPILSLNTVSLLGAEVMGRAYGGGVLKMEPREAAGLPVPSLPVAERAWAKLEPNRALVHELMRLGNWEAATKEVDAVVLSDAMALPSLTTEVLRSGLNKLRRRRNGRAPE